MSGTEKSTVWQKLAKTLPDDIETSDEVREMAVGTRRDGGGGRGDKSVTKSEMEGKEADWLVGR